MTSIALYPGSFDPITKGHMALIKQACTLFDSVVVAIAINTQKNNFFKLEKRIQMLEVALQSISNATISTFDGLTVDYAEKIKARCIIRGLRMASDFEFEFQLAGMNQDLNPSIHTCFLPAISEYSHISSSMTREVLSLGGDISHFVDPNVLALIQKD